MACTVPLMWHAPPSPKRQVFTPTDRLALAVGALGHDIGHTGTNNAFLIASNDERALRYNDRSVLESMHCSFLFQ
eukprot:6355682-Prymnesium_polylepis.1